MDALFPEVGNATLELLERFGHDGSFFRFMGKLIEPRLVDAPERA
jgi:hypothetical protein